VNLEFVKFHSVNRFLLVLVFLIYWPGLSLGQIKNVSVVSDLSNGWMILEDGQFKIIQSDKIGRKAIHFYIKDADDNSNLLMKVPAGSSIWIDNNLFELFEKDTTIIISSEKILNGKKERLISVYGRGLNKTSLETKLINPSFIQSRTPEKRSKTDFDDYYSISFFIGLLLVVFLKMSSTGNIQEYFMIGRTFNARSRDEVLFKSKLLTSPNPIFYLVLSFLASQLLITLFILAPESFNQVINYRALGVWGLIFLQFLILLAFYIWILLKWMIIKYLAGLFRISEFSPVHFFNYQRLSLFILLFVSAVLFGIYFGQGSTLADYSLIIWVILFGAAFRIILILIKLLNASSYKFLHLFSYLCATEIIPYLFAIKLILI